MKKKYLIEIEIEIDFDEIFSKIPKGLFDDDPNGGSDKDYEVSMIYDCLQNSYLAVLDKKSEALVKDKEDGLYKYLEHHLECELQVAKQLSKNAKIKLIS